MKREVMLRTVGRKVSGWEREGRRRITGRMVRMVKATCFGGGH